MPTVNPTIQPHPNYLRRGKGNGFQAGEYDSILMRTMSSFGGDGLLSQNVPELMQCFRRLRLKFETVAKADQKETMKLVKFMTTKVLDSKIQSLALRREVGLFLAAILSDGQMSLMKTVFEKIKSILSGTKRDIDNRLCSLECILRLIRKLKRQFAALFFPQIITIVTKQIRDSNDEIRELSLEVLELTHWIKIYVLPSLSIIIYTSRTPSRRSHPPGSHASSQCQRHTGANFGYFPDNFSVLICICNHLRAAADRNSARVRYCAGRAVAIIVAQLQDIKELNLFTLPCQKALNDPNSEVRICFAAALGCVFAVAAMTHQQQKGGEALSSLDRGLSCLQTFFTKEQAAQSRAMFAHSLAVLLKKTPKLVRKSSTQEITKKLLGFLRYSAKGTFAAIRTEADARQSAECMVYVLWNGLFPICDDRALEAVGETLLAEIKHQVQRDAVAGIYQNDVASSAQDGVSSSSPL
eukprot:jgi/Bigna1/72752/fgenesh1_pg.21_\